MYIFTDQDDNFTPIAIASSAAAATAAAFRRTPKPKDKPKSGNLFTLHAASNNREYT
jgi:hypothetical protein